MTASVVIDQSPLGGNARSTVGTISGLYSSLRLLFSRIGKPYAGTASYFSFNDPNGMCKTCSGLGKVTKVDIKALIDPEKSWNEAVSKILFTAAVPGIGDSMPGPVCLILTNRSKIIPEKSTIFSCMAPETEEVNRRIRKLPGSIINIRKHS